MQRTRHGGEGMIDFSEVGYVHVSEVNGEQCVQFAPYANKTVKDMLDVLDEGLARINTDDSPQKRERTILLNTDKSKKKGYPIPCVIIIKKEG